MSLADPSLPLVSIVAVNYNNSKYVIETLDSIAAQTYQNVELIVVDDCSTDDSAQKIEQWSIDYKKPFKFIRSPQNEGVCATFNKGYQAATGEYIASLATDDLMLPAKIESQVSFFETMPAETGMIFCDAYLIGDDSEKLYGTFIQRFRKFDKVPTGDIFDDLVEGNFIPAMAIMIRSSILKTIGYFDENLPFEDYDMWLRIAKRYKVVFQDEITAVYRKRKTSLTSTFKPHEWMYTGLRILSKHKDAEAAKNRMATLITNLYFDGYPCKEISKNYGVLDNRFTYRCIKLGIPSNITRSLLTLLKRL